MAVSPAAEQIPQASDPLVAPAATRAPARRPAISELRSTSRLSGPGVMVRISDKTANAAILSIIALPSFSCRHGLWRRHVRILEFGRAGASLSGFLPGWVVAGVSAQCGAEIGEQLPAVPDAYGCGWVGRGIAQLVDRDSRPA